MVEVRRSTIVNAPIDEVWAILRDFNGHGQWHPAVASSRIEEGAPADLIGAVRDFRLEDGSRIREQLLSLSDDGHGFTYCILESPLPLYGYVASVRLKPVTDGARTFWEWRSTFEPPAHRKAELVKLVGDGIYEAGFRAIKGMLGHMSRPAKTAAPERPPQMAAASVIAGSEAVHAKAIVMMRHGGPDVLELREVSVGSPGFGEVRIRQTAIGVNYIDVYCRTGYFDLIKPPGVPGMEAAGMVESIGPGVTDFRVGDRVAYACAPTGSYAEMRVMKSEFLVHVPDFLSDEQVAASLLKGITASFLLHDVYQVKPGDIVLAHAAAGGVGLLLVQWAKALGASVIGTTSSEEKAMRIRQLGCDHVINYVRDDFAEGVMAITSGRGADVVYDAVGKDTFEMSLRALKTRGTLVSFGQASGDIGAYEIGKLAAKSITLSRPNYGHYTETREDFLRHAHRFFAAVKAGSILIDHPKMFALSDAKTAHESMEGRGNIGSVILQTRTP